MPHGKGKVKYPGLEDLPRHRTQHAGEGASKFTIAQKDALLALEWKNPNKPDPRTQYNHTLEMAELYLADEKKKPKPDPKLVAQYEKTIAEEKAKPKYYFEVVFDLLEEEQKRQKRETPGGNRRTKYLDSDDDNDSDTSAEFVGVPVKPKKIEGTVYDTVTIKGVTYVYTKGTRDFLGIMKLKRMAESDILVPIVSRDVRYQDPLVSDSEEE